jgi:hypothetical protein
MRRLPNMPNRSNKRSSLPLDIGSVVRRQKGNAFVP